MADTLDFVGAGVTASGTGATKTITIPGGGGGSPFCLDTLALDGTYGDDFTGALDGKWTAQGISANELQCGVSGTYLAMVGSILNAILQAFTLKDEADVIVSFSSYVYTETGFIGPFIVSTAMGGRQWWVATVQAVLSQSASSSYPLASGAEAGV